MVNVMGSLPASTSTQFHLSQVDWLKILRIFLVQVLGIVASELPKLAGYTYVYKGTDYTTEVVLVVNTGAELIRRFLAGQKAAASV
jgi:hypothetical protein